MGGIGVCASWMRRHILCIVFRDTSAGGEKFKTVILHVIVYTKRLGDVQCEWNSEGSWRESGMGVTNIIDIF